MATTEPSSFGTASGTWAAPTAGTHHGGMEQDGTGATVVNGNSVTTDTADAINFGNGGNWSCCGHHHRQRTVDAGSLTYRSGTGTITLSGGTINHGTQLQPATVINTAQASLRRLLIPTSYRATRLRQLRFQRHRLRSRHASAGNISGAGSTSGITTLTGQQCRFTLHSTGPTAWRRDDLPASYVQYHRQQLRRGQLCSHGGFATLTLALDRRTVATSGIDAVASR